MKNEKPWYVPFNINVSRPTIVSTNNKDEDQTARTRCLITVFVIRCLEGMTDSLATSRSLSYEPWFTKIRYM